MKLIIPIIASVLLFCCTLGLTPERLVADDISPELVQISTPIYKPDLSNFDPALGTYTYSISWQGISAAEAKLSVAQDELHYLIQADARTNGFVDIFYKLRYRAHGLLSSFDFLPVRTVIDQSENSRVKQIVIDFEADGSIRSERTQAGKEPQILNFKSNNFTLDPFSAAFLARSLSWKEHETKEFDTFNGKTRYLIKLTAVDRTTFKINGQETPVWVISPEVKNLTSTKPSNKLRSALIYVTDDKYRDILQITSEVFIGSVKTRLESFEPANNLGTGTRMAREYKISNLDLSR